MKWAVVGGGISGLAHAFELASLGHEATVYEAAPRAGGNIRTERQDGYAVEWGPNGFLDNVPETFDLVRRLGIADRLRPSSDAARVRYLWRRGALRRLPETPPAFLASPILTLPGRLRVLLEPFARSRPRHDETVLGFASRRIGPEAAVVLVQAMVSGVYAGDARRLSLRSTFPKMHAMEAAHGGLFRALLARRKSGAARGGPAGPGGVLTSFAAGFSEIVDALVARLGSRVRLGTPVTGLARRDGEWVVEGPEERADAVVLAVPARTAGRILARLEPEAADLLGAVPVAPLAVVALAYPETAIGGAPAGFGFLAPPGEGLRILGCLWDSSVFPGCRAPPGKALLRAMIGGARDPGAAEMDDEALLGAVGRDLGRAMGIAAAPERTWIFRHPQGIPQYVRGHGARLARVARLLSRFPGLRLAGNSYRGISVNACVEEAACLRQRK